MLLYAPIHDAVKVISFSPIFNYAKIHPLTCMASSQVFKVGELLENVFLRLMRVCVGGGSKLKSLRRKHRRKVIGHGAEG